MYYPFDEPAQRGHLSSIFFAKKYRRLFCGLVIGTIVLFLVSVVTGITVFDYQHNNIVFEYLLQEDDLAVLSTTYYKSSKSFPNDTVVILFNAHQVFSMKHQRLVVFSSNETESSTSALEIRQVIDQVPFYCKWVPYLAVGQLVKNANWLEFQYKTDGANLEMRIPYKERNDVVACFSPLFHAENWELLLLTAEVYSHYGAFMHFYVRSMITPLFHLLKRYKNSRIAPWPGVKLGPQRASSSRFNANLELEFRNQASAMTDCLLMYKEAAEYIMFPDPDDLIIPQLGYSFYSEFNTIFNFYPLAATVIYNITQTDVATTFNIKDYSPTDVLNSIRFRGEQLWGKQIVKPERLDSVWIHTSYDIKEGFESVALPIYNNSVIHLRFWNYWNKAPEVKMTKYNPLGKKRVYGKDLIVAKDLAEIQSAFKNRMRENKELFLSLPSQSIYRPLVDQCYNRIFYNGRQHSTCKGPELCDIPAFPGVKCMNVEYRYETFTKLKGLFVHILRQSTFNESFYGCTI